MNEYSKNIIIFFGVILSLILAFLLWDQIKLPYSNPEEIVSIFSEFHHNKYNDHNNEYTYHHHQGDDHLWVHLIPFSMIILFVQTPPSPFPLMVQTHLLTARGLCASLLVNQSQPLVLVFQSFCKAPSLLKDIVQLAS